MKSTTLSNVSSGIQEEEKICDILVRRIAQEGLTDEQVGIYIFGSGEGGSVLLEYLRNCNAINHINYKIKGFFDNNLSKQGSNIEELRVIALRKDVIGVRDFVIIASLNYCDEMYRQLLDMGVVEERIIYTGNWLIRLLRPDIDFCPGHLRSNSNFKRSFIDIVDACNLRCATCPRGEIRGTGHKMSLEMFCNILDKLKTENYSLVGLYNWSEPFLHPELLSFVKEVKARSFVCGISSNLSLSHIPNFVDVLDALNPSNGDYLLVSISGMKQSVYEVNHKGGNIETVKKNLEIASKSKNKGAIIVKLIKFSYNRKEEEEVIRFCKKLGIAYETINGFGDPLITGDIIEREATSKVDEISHLHYCRELESLARCTHIFDSIPINSDGDVYLCCATPPMQSYILGSFLEQDLPTLTLKRFFHPDCATCPLPRDKFSERDLMLLVAGLKHVCQ
jgi:MoaA/NifB/PqqE/SkfB family radical SAM enzyme